ncbi:MAG: hypothetical protein JST31_14680 [Actinobacteria bacterium]|nr:hypothetical protein [Actinomycetota bacterium]
MTEPNGSRRSDEEMLEGLLGPSDPELSCEECFAALDRYVELTIAAEAADERVPGMRAHLAGCPACAEDYRSLRDLLAADEVETPR